MPRRGAVSRSLSSAADFSLRSLSANRRSTTLGAIAQNSSQRLPVTEVKAAGAGLNGRPGLDVASGRAAHEIETHADTLGHLPAAQRGRILSGMRWTVWLSALAVPFSLAVNLLLARVGPETLGVYGQLSIYVSLTSAFLYFGGDPVIIRFIPECLPKDRPAFLVSYLAVILAVMGGWITFAWLCPAAMQLALGKTNASAFYFVVLCLAVVPILFAMIVAALKGMLEIRASQILAKLLTIVSLAVYAAFFFFARSLLFVHPTPIIWSVYLGISATLAVIGAYRLIRLFRVRQLHWFLPDGFWRYALSMQQASITSFFVGRLDYMLVVNFGGLRLLGKYVAVLALAAVVRMVSGFFMDTLLPSLTNTITAHNHAGAAQVFTMHMRILFVVIVGVSSALMVLAVPATTIMGPKYASLAGPIIFMACAYGMASPPCGGTVLTSIGRQQLLVWTNVLNLVLFVCLFIPLWGRWNLTGAVVASGATAVISNTILTLIALKTARFLPSISDVWLKSAAVQAIVAFVALWWMPLGLANAILIWLGAMLLFLWLAHYDLPECRRLVRMFVPGLSSES